jgi:hypothetical protein
MQKIGQVPFFRANRLVLRYNNQVYINERTYTQDKVQILPPQDYAHVAAGRTTQPNKVMLSVKNLG